MPAAGLLSIATLFVLFRKILICTIKDYKEDSSINNFIQQKDRVIVMSYVIKYKVTRKI